ncbi:Major facilitator superfamily domain, general substrate transporter [Penicillium digitatum]|uniref:Major facilitator superfamily domain, general substrate transporter n=1 Tax=Penicillium digitatum TaxID=36651 RepID=A0A7T6XI47_PENDI|nr:Major facilitator superfamily domain, general substrate transporter [Penicillium digitatum]
MGNKSSSASDEGFDETKDLEAANPTTLNEHFSCADANANRDPVLITWSGPDDLENPKNWQNAPARQDLDKALGMHSDIERYLSMAIVILTYSIGPIFFGPSSELYGRVRLLQISNVWCLAWNLGCGFAQTTSQLFAFRVLAGIGGSAPLAIGGATCGAPKNVARPWASTLLYSTWRWVFWATSAAAVGVQVAGLIWLRECHLSTILRKRRDALVQKTGNHNRHTDQKVEKLVYKLLPAFERPVILFTTQPIVFCMAIYMAYLFGVTYLSHLRLSRTSGLGSITRAPAVAD